MTDKELASPANWGEDVLEVARLGLGPGNAVYATFLSDTEKTAEEVEMLLATLVNGLLMTACIAHYPQEELEETRQRGLAALQRAYVLLEDSQGKASLERFMEN